MTSLAHSHFMVVTGRCLGCGEAGQKVVVSREPIVATLGVCDLCSYAIRHAWKRELGEVVAATSPKTVATYILLARLPEGRSELDVSAYEFLVRSAPLYGQDRVVLPSCEFMPFGRLSKHMEGAWGVMVWEPVMREIYLGYSGTGEFSSVVLAGAWGAVPGQKIIGERKTYAELLSQPTPDAGFHLGVKSAFESLLWSKETAGEDAALDYRTSASIMLGEGAVRCLGENEDLKMIEAFKSMLTPAEAEVVRLVKEWRREEKEALREREAEHLKVAAGKSEESPQDVDASFEEAAETSQDLKSIPPGYARAPR